MSKGEPFDAVIAGNDQMAIAVYRLLTAKGFGIPRDVKLTGFNGFSFLDYFEKRITTVRSPAFQLGMLGAHHMVRRLEYGTFDAKSVILPVEFVLGETS